MVHLNNDAVQKHGDNYGKFESANKMSLDELPSSTKGPPRCQGSWCTVVSLFADFFLCPHAVVDLWFVVASKT